MNGLDFLIMALGAAGAAYGLARGALRMVTSVVSLVAAVYLASVYYPRAAEIAESQLAVNSTLAAAIGYAAVFAAVFAAVELAGRAVSRILRTVHLGWADRLGGGVLGVASAGAVAGLSLMVLAAVLPAEAALLRQSELAPQVLGYTETLLAYVPPEVKQAYNQKRAELYRYWLKRESGPSAGPSPSAAK